MDWLIDTTDPGVAAETAARLLAEHLSRHAAEADGLVPLVRGVDGDLAEAVATANGRPLHLRLDWTSRRAVLDVAAVDVGEQKLPLDLPVSADQRAAVRSLPREPLTSLEFPAVRRLLHAFEAAPPPSLDVGLDPAVQGSAAVARALAAALKAHPSATAPQTASVAGAMIAATVLDGDDRPTDARAVAEVFVRLHEALGAEAYVVMVDDDRLDLAVSRCLFTAGEGPAASLCHVSSGLAGQLAAAVNGSATVVLDEALVDGAPECHLQVLLRPGPDDVVEHPGAEPYFCPSRGDEAAMKVPRLELSVALPRESVSVPVVRRLAAQALRAFGVHEEDVDDVQLAITEACANVIDHASATDSYDVSIELSADRCAITVVDRGGGFDHTQVPDEVEGDSEMGRGLALMRALVDNVAFRNEPQAGAVVHMVKSLRYDADHPMRQL